MKNFLNQTLDKKGTKKIITWFLNSFGPTKTSLFLEELKSVGFHQATISGLSLGFDDLKIPTGKEKLLETAEISVLDFEKKFQKGKITAVERYQKLLDIWTTASETLKDSVIQNFQKLDILNPLYMMAFSGARGNISQVRQLVGMRGLMSDSAGGIIDFPIRRNFREGLTVTEYAISCYGARKGLIDTALRTADSGYLTRRLVDVAHGILIGKIDCKTVDGFDMYPLTTTGKSGTESIVVSLEKRIIGRILAEPELASQEGVASSGRASGLAEGPSLRRYPLPVTRYLLACPPNPPCPPSAGSVGRKPSKSSLPSNRLLSKSPLLDGQRLTPRSGGLLPSADSDPANRVIEITPLIAEILVSKAKKQKKYTIRVRSPLTCGGVSDIHGFSFVDQGALSEATGGGTITGEGQLSPWANPSKTADSNQSRSLDRAHCEGSAQYRVSKRDIDRNPENICQLCYGWSLAHARLVSLGDAVGVLAAQSIGEPGTQLTMRTFHTGGIFSTELEAKIFAPQEGYIGFSKTRPKGKKIRTFHGQTAFFTFEPIQLKIYTSVGSSSEGMPGGALRAWSPDITCPPGRLRGAAEGGQAGRKPINAGPYRNAGEPSMPSFGSVVTKTESDLVDSKSSIFYLPKHSLIFVSAGQKVFKQSLCAEISHVVGAKQNSHTSVLESPPLQLGPRSAQLTRYGYRPVSERTSRAPSGRSPESADRASYEVSVDSTLDTKESDNLRFTSALAEGHASHSPPWAGSATSEVKVKSINNDLASEFLTQTPEGSLLPSILIGSDQGSTKPDAYLKKVTSVSSSAALRPISNGQRPTPRTDSKLLKNVKTDQSFSQSRPLASVSNPSKKVLSDIEGQVYFSNLRQRQVSRYSVVEGLPGHESLGLVTKGDPANGASAAAGGPERVLSVENPCENLTSLLILNGRGLSTYPFFSSGDFFHNLKKIKGKVKDTDSLGHCGLRFAFSPKAKSKGLRPISLASGHSILGGAPVRTPRAMPSKLGGAPVLGKLGEAQKAHPHNCSASKGTSEAKGLVLGGARHWIFGVWVTSFIRQSQTGGLLFDSYVNPPKSDGLFGLRSLRFTSFREVKILRTGRLGCGPLKAGDIWLKKLKSISLNEGSVLLIWQSLLLETGQAKVGKGSLLGNSKAKISGHSVTSLSFQRNALPVTSPTRSQVNAVNIRQAYLNNFSKIFEGNRFRIPAARPVRYSYKDYRLPILTPWYCITGQGSIEWPQANPKARKFTFSSSAKSEELRPSKAHGAYPPNPQCPPSAGSAGKAGPYFVRYEPALMGNALHFWVGQRPLDTGRSLGGAPVQGEVSVRVRTLRAMPSKLGGAPVRTRQRRASNSKGKSYVVSRYLQSEAMVFSSNRKSFCALKPSLRFAATKYRMAFGQPRCGVLPYKIGYTPHIKINASSSLDFTSGLYRPYLRYEGYAVSQAWSPKATESVSHVSNEYNTTQRSEGPVLAKPSLRSNKTSKGFPLSSIVKAKSSLFRSRVITDSSLVLSGEFRDLLVPTSVLAGAEPAGGEWPALRGEQSYDTNPHSPPNPYCPPSAGSTGGSEITSDGASYSTLGEPFTREEPTFASQVLVAQGPAADSDQRSQPLLRRPQNQIQGLLLQTQHQRKFPWTQNVKKNKMILGTCWFPVENATTARACYPLPLPLPPAFGGWVKAGGKSIEWPKVNPAKTGIFRQRFLATEEAYDFPNNVNTSSYILSKFLVRKVALSKSYLWAQDHPARFAKRSPGRLWRRPEEAGAPRAMSSKPMNLGKFRPVSNASDRFTPSGRRHVDLRPSSSTANRSRLRRAVTYPEANLQIVLRKFQSYTFSSHSPLFVKHGDIVLPRQCLFELIYQQSKTGDIVQGLPKIEELFEARRTSAHVIESIHSRLKQKFDELCLLLPLYEATKQSIRFIQRILVDEIQLVYQSQGVEIGDKHIEIIVRQMTSKVIIHETGKTSFFPDDIINFYRIPAPRPTIRQYSPPNPHSTPAEKGFAHQCGFAIPSSAGYAGGLRPVTALTSGHSIPVTSSDGRAGGPASSFGIVEGKFDSNQESRQPLFLYEPIVLGITKIAFFTESFVSAASFQEAKRVLMQCALESRVDFLHGLKENVILGRFIQAGTGSPQS